MGRNIVCIVLLFCTIIGCNTNELEGLPNYMEPRNNTQVNQAIIAVIASEWQTTTIAYGSYLEAFIPACGENGVLVRWESGRTNNIEVQALNSNRESMRSRFTNLDNLLKTLYNYNRGLW